MRVADKTSWTQEELRGESQVIGDRPTVAENQERVGQDPLQERRRAQCNIQNLGRAELSPWMQKVIWLLRIYVLCMLAAVAINIAELLH